jgi:hypothetical protein
MSEQKPFEREVRYYVFKISDMRKYLSAEKQEIINSIAAKITAGRAVDGKDALQAVVVEHDWPEYEQVWGMIEDRMGEVQDAPFAKIIGNYRLETFLAGRSYALRLIGHSFGLKEMLVGLYGYPKTKSPVHVPDTDMQAVIRAVAWLRLPDNHAYNIRLSANHHAVKGSVVFAACASFRGKKFITCTAMDIASSISRVLDALNAHVRQEASNSIKKSKINDITRLVEPLWVTVTLGTFYFLVAIFALFGVSQALNPPAAGMLDSKVSECIDSGSTWVINKKFSSCLALDKE